MIWAMLKNTKTGRYHPILFRHAPMPSGADIESGALRHKSAGHHTDGFDTVKEAQAYLQDSAEKTGYRINGALWEWNGEGIPALTQWFASERSK